MAHRARRAFAIAFASVALVAGVAIATWHHAIANLLNPLPHSCGGG